jgi:Tripartite tricarboxylate transporter TctB family
MSKLKNIAPAEWALATMLLLASVAAFVASFGLPPPALEPIGPAAFPRATAIILFLLTVRVLIGALRADGAPVAPVGYRRRYDLLIVLSAATVIYVGVMQVGWLGFREATVVFVFGLAMALFDLKVRYLLPVAVIALAMGVGLSWLFTSLLYVDLP